MELLRHLQIAVRPWRGATRAKPSAIVGASQREARYVRLHLIPHRRVRSEARLEHDGRSPLACAHDMQGERPDRNVRLGLRDLRMTRETKQRESAHPEANGHHVSSL